MRAGVRGESRRVEGARERLSPCRAPAARATRARASRRVLVWVELEHEHDSLSCSLPSPQPVEPWTAREDPSILGLVSAVLALGRLRCSGSEQVLALWRKENH